MAAVVVDWLANLARETDLQLARQWSSAPVAGYLTTRCPPGELRLVPLMEPADRHLRRLEPVQGISAVLSALGWASAPDGGLPVRIRMTVAVSCCASVGVMRRLGGGAVTSQQVDGELVEHLRRWAGLTTCMHPGEGA